MTFTAFYQDIRALSILVAVTFSPPGRDIHGFFAKISELCQFWWLSPFHLLEPAHHVTRTRHDHRRRPCPGLGRSHRLGYPLPRVRAQNRRRPVLGRDGLRARAERPAPAGGAHGAGRLFPMKPLNPESPIPNPKSKAATPAVWPAGQSRDRRVRPWRAGRRPRG